MQMSPYELFCRHVVLPFGDLAFGTKVSSRFRFFEKFQWLSTDEIHEYRQRRFKDLAAFSFDRVPYYRAVFKSLGIHNPGAELGLENISELPVLTKGHLRSEFESLKVLGFRGSVEEMRSSGSTGAQTVVLIDKACFNDVYGTQLLWWSWGGFHMGKPHLQTGMSEKRGRLRSLKDLVFRCSYCSAFKLGDADLERMVRTIQRRKIRAVFGYASSIYVLAKYAERRRSGISLDSVFTWGDCLFPHYREQIERTFSCRVNDCYGLGEGLQCAAQCERRESLHEAMHSVIVEIVDRDGRPCPPGQLGTVLLTRLEPGPMPLIRYESGDVAHWVDGSCDCGRHLRLISRIQGRDTDIVTTPHGDRLIVHYFTQIFEMIPQIAQFQVRQSVPDRIKILYIPAEGFEPAILEAIRRQILEYCEYPLGIEFEAVDHIPLEKSNKRRFVISSIAFSA